MLTKLYHKKIYKYIIIFTHIIQKNKQLFMNFTRKKPQSEFKHGIALLSDPQLSRLTIWSGIFQLNGLAAYTPCSNLKKYLFLYQPERLSELLGRNSEKPFKP
mgnify:CR=1